MEEAQAVKYFITALSTPKDVMEDPQFIGRGFWVEVDHPVSGRQTYTGAPVKIGEDGWRVRSPAPMLGQHNQEILGGLGFKETEIDQFNKNGII
jgi:crotonobetainyl-CoA:carnitine CoA-transferase CaiB-like acyl-CoA transferase